MPLLGSHPSQLSFLCTSGEVKSERGGVVFSKCVRGFPLVTAFHMLQEEIGV